MYKVFIVEDETPDPGQPAEPTAVPRRNTPADFFGGSLRRGNGIGLNHGCQAGYPADRYPDALHGWPEFGKGSTEDLPLDPDHLHQRLR